MTDAAFYIQRLLEADPLRKPVLQEAVEFLHLPQGSHGLDAGCGIGLQTVLLAKAVGTDGSIAGIDLIPDLLAYGEKLIGQSGLSDRITFHLGDVSRLPFAGRIFDWVWSADCVGYPAGELSTALKELIRVVKPGGRIILLGWSSQQLLPGYPLLEAQLNATCSGYIPFLKDRSPEFHFPRALGAFRDADLTEVKAHTFVSTVQSPLSPGERLALTSLFDMLWGQPQPDVLSEDWEAYRRLCSPVSPDFILDIPGYYAFFTCSMFQGIVPS